MSRSSLAYLLYTSVFALGIVITGGGAAHGAAQTSTTAIDPAILKAYKWRSIGPAKGGRSIAVSGVKGRRNEAYFGAVGGGLWKTTDFGEEWTPEIGRASCRERV